MRIAKLILVTLIVFLVGASTVFGCRAHTPNNWFFYSFQVDESTLPEGISVNYDNQGFRYYYVQPATYLISQSDEEIYFVDSESGEIGNSSFSLISPYKVSLSGGALVPQRNDKPRKVEVPESEPFSINISYQGVQTEVKGTVIYSLNEGYSERNPCDWYGAEVILLIILIFPLLIPLIATIIVRKKGKSKKAQLLSAIIGFAVAFAIYYLIFYI